VIAPLPGFHLCFRHLNLIQYMVDPTLARCHIFSAPLNLTQCILYPAEQVAQEMVQELGLPDSDLQIIARYIIELAESAREEGGLVMPRGGHERNDSSVHNPLGGVNPNPNPKGGAGPGPGRGAPPHRGMLFAAGDGYGRELQHRPEHPTLPRSVSSGHLPVYSSATTSPAPDSMGQGDFAGQGGRGPPDREAGHAPSRSGGGEGLDSSAYGYGSHPGGHMGGHSSFDHTDDECSRNSPPASLGDDEDVKFTPFSDEDVDVEELDDGEFSRLKIEYEKNVQRSHKAFAQRMDNLKKSRQVKDLPELSS
jgi:hypothetical protein